MGKTINKTQHIFKISAQNKFNEIRVSLDKSSEIVTITGFRTTDYTALEQMWLMVNEYAKKNGAHKFMFNVQMKCEDLEMWLNIANDHIGYLMFSDGSVLFKK